MIILLLRDTQLDLCADIRAAVASEALRTVLEDGEILLIDNYRCWHGHDTPRMINILTVRTTDAM